MFSRIARITLQRRNIHISLQPPEEFAFHVHPWFQNISLNADSLSRQIGFSKVANALAVPSTIQILNIWQGWSSLAYKFYFKKVIKHSSETGFGFPSKCI